MWRITSGLGSGQLLSALLDIDDPFCRVAQRRLSRGKLVKDGA